MVIRERYTACSHVIKARVRIDFFFCKLKKETFVSIRERTKK